MAYMNTTKTTTDEFARWLDSSPADYDAWAVVEHTARCLSFDEGSAQHIRHDVLTGVCATLGIMSGVQRETVRDFIKGFAADNYDHGQRID